MGYDIAGRKTEHAGPKKGRGAYHGRKVAAKAESNKERRRVGKALAGNPDGNPGRPFLPECGYCGSPDLKEIPTDPECWEGTLYDCLRCGKANTVYPSVAA